MDIINNIIEYYYAFFHSEDGVDVSDTIIFNCADNSASCAEFTRDKSYLEDIDYICFDPSVNYCYEQFDKN